MKVIYVYDALCGWCYGFSPVIRAFRDQHPEIPMEVLSGGMILGEREGPLSEMAAYIIQAYKSVEQTTGITFGNAFLQELEKGEMWLSSEKPAIALSVLKERYPEKAVDFAHDLQQEIYFNGRGPTEDAPYRYLAVNFGFDPDEFMAIMASDAYKQKAYYDFALSRQLHVSGYPAVLVQADELHFHLIARGYTDLDTLSKRFELVRSELS